MKPTAKELRELLPNASDEFIQANTESDGVKKARTIAVALKGGITKRSKYNAVPTVYNGILYDSKKEMNYYIRVLEPLLKAGELDYVLYHVPFIVGNDPLTKYEADFVTLVKLPDWEKGWNIEVIEVKGAWTPVARKKIKLFRKRYPSLTLRIV